MGVLSDVKLWPIKNVGTSSIEQFAPIAVTGVDVVQSGKNDLIVLKVKGLDSFQTSDLTYGPIMGLNVEGKIAANKQGAGRFEYSPFFVAACEDTSLAATDLLVMERTKAHLQKLDNGHSSVYGVYRSLREISTESGWRKHLVTPVYEFLFCELTATLSAPSSMIVSATTANAKLKIHDKDNAGKLIDGPTLKISNRWKDLSLASGKRLYVQLNPHFGEWVIVATECP